LSAPIGARSVVEAQGLLGQAEGAAERLLSALGRRRRACERGDGLGEVRGDREGTLGEVGRETPRAFGPHRLRVASGRVEVIELATQGGDLFVVARTEPARLVDRGDPQGFEQAPQISVERSRALLRCLVGAAGIVEARLVRGHRVRCRRELPLGKGDGGPRFVEPSSRLCLSGLGDLVADREGMEGARRLFTRSPRLRLLRQLEGERALSLGHDLFFAYEER
jgi:hypothetical protein